jgi:hypothetical protein
LPTLLEEAPKMKPRVVRWIGLCALVVVTGCAIAALGNDVHRARVYSVAAARAALMSAPDRWVGRTLYVRGLLDGCPPVPAPCPIWQPRLFDPTRASARGALPVERIPDPQLVFWQRIPLLGNLLSMLHMTHWGTVATYRLQVQSYPVSTCTSILCPSNMDFSVFYCDPRTCYRAVLLDGVR